MARACRERDIKTVAVSAGYVCPEPRREFYQYMDAANIDLKAFSERFYKYLTGSRLEPVLDTLIYLKQETSVWFEITTLLIPGENDSDGEIESMTHWIMDHLGPDVPLHFSAFHPDWKMLDHSPTPVSTLIRARDIARRNGLHFVYTGNVHYIEGDTTYCSACGEALIVRDWYNLKEWNIKDLGSCGNCGRVCPGVFEAVPGDWGSKRMPVRLS